MTAILPSAALLPPQARDVSAELFSGTTSPLPDPDADTRPEVIGAKANPDVNPDTRMHLHPATDHMVAPDLPAYPLSTPAERAAAGFLAGLLGAVVLTAF